ncbi:molecular chaperone [Gramella jeungdoensis]|uniref:Molecular chaperone n=1 Tax=Gramella jeungdoensis TaxID=708091 RepID=A0ABT0Z4K6_9FLAO|nr:molecular chaperone [Gramella jeungdoensis]MCM8570150.1 molecular chaperone [Gramella jeungdoensis]
MKIAPPYLLTLIFLFIFQSVFAQGDLMIMPKRLVFDGSERSQEISLANTGNDSATYAISFLQYKMKEDGSFEQITEPEDGQRFADNFLRYYPRRVSLAPNEAQTVRLQLTRTGEMNEGEYRSHLYFRAVEEQTALGSEETKENDGNISINIKTVFGISIPVIIRKGTSTTKVDLTNVSFDSDNKIISLDIEREGNMSVYGNLQVEHHSENIVSSEVGVVKGVAVYTPNEKRHFSFQLQNPENIELKKGKLVISYRTDKGKVLATTSYDLE